MSSFTAKKLDMRMVLCETSSMGNDTSPSTVVGNTAETVRRCIESGGERFWRLSDFDGMPFPAVAQALSRLCRRGEIRRVGKGLYYRPRQTVFGESQPNPVQVSALPIPNRGVFPADLAAAQILGFTTQSPAQISLATDGVSLPRLIVGKGALVHTRRPSAWRQLGSLDTAILDFIRHRGEMTELSPEDTVLKLIEHCSEPGRFDRLMRVAATEPPRVRAIMGAIGQQMGLPQASLEILRKSLNPLSRFDFGLLVVLKYAKLWQAKDRKS